jgi:hypothetical protein
MMQRVDQRTDRLTQAVVARREYTEITHSANLGGDAG